MTTQQAVVRRRFHAVYLLWLLVPILLWWSLRGIALRDIGRSLAALSLAQIALLMGVNALVVLTFSGRWWMLIRALDYRIPYLTVARYRLAAFSVSYFTPGPHFGGEPLAVYLLKFRHDVPTTTATATVTLDKLLELIVNFSFLIVGLILTIQSRAMGQSLAGPAILAAVGLLLLPLLYLIALWRQRYVGTAVIRLLTRVGLAERFVEVASRVEHQASALCRERPQYVVGALVFSLISWTGLILEYGMAYTYLGLPVSLPALISLLTAARIAILLPAPGGLGTFEASQVWMLGLLGLPAPVGLSLSLLVHARDIIFGLLGMMLAGEGLRRWNYSRK